MGIGGYDANIGSRHSEFDIELELEYEWSGPKLDNSHSHEFRPIL